MKRTYTAFAWIAWLSVGSWTAPAGEKTISGQVVDPDGKPIIGAEVAVGWNCSGKDNRLEPVQRIRTDRTGRFSGTVPCDEAPVPIMALDKDRSLGVLRIVPIKDLSKPLKLEAAPLGTVEGRIDLGEFEKAPTKFRVEISAAEGMISLLTVDLPSPRIALRLPLGNYGLTITADGAEGLNEAVELTAEERRYDLGKLLLHPDKSNEAKGKPAPELTITAAHGIRKDIKLSDFKGKWVLIDFWAFW